MSTKAPSPKIDLDLTLIVGRSRAFWQFFFPKMRAGLGEAVATHERGGKNLERLAVVGGAEREGAPGVGLGLRQVGALVAADRSPLKVETGELGVVPCRERVPRDPCLVEGEVQLQDLALVEPRGGCLGPVPLACQGEGGASRSEERNDEREPAERGWPAQLGAPT